MPKKRSPFDERMRAFGARRGASPLDPLHASIVAAVRRRTPTELELRLKISELREQAPYFVFTRMAGGSGFPMSKAIRHFFLEYFDRFTNRGPEFFPTSFNVLQSFLYFSERFRAFDIRQEREYLLRLHEYLDWYTAGSFPDDPSLLRAILSDGIIYEYNFIDPINDFSFRTPTSELRLAGVSAVRHGGDVSLLMLAGENPPYPPDEDAETALKEGSPAVGREDVHPEPSLSTNDRYHPELPGWSRVVVLARFDIDRAQYDVRYVNVDLGPSYLVITDDPAVANEIPSEERKGYDEATKDRIARYAELFSAAVSLLYLPAFVADQGSRLVESKFATELRNSDDKSFVRGAMKRLGPSAVPFFRSVSCVAGTSAGVEGLTRSVDPPNFAFESTGYWKPLAAGEIGEDRDGNPVVSKTWVERHDSWSVRTLESFVIAKAKRPVAGSDPGTVYIMRSGSHYADLYKVGITRRTTSERAVELSSDTGVPTRFETLAEWEVGNCAEVERRVHECLKHLRINRRREFFSGNLADIIAVVNGVVDNEKLLVT